MTGLKRIRQSRGMSMEELGKAVGVSRQVVSAWELGIYWPKASSLPRIAEVLGCTIDELFRETTPSVSSADSSTKEEPYKEELPWN